MSCFVRLPRAPSAKTVYLPAQLHAAGEARPSARRRGRCPCRRSRRRRRGPRRRPAPRRPESPDRSRPRAPRPCARDSARRCRASRRSCRGSSISFGIGQLRQAQAAGGGRGRGTRRASPRSSSGRSGSSRQSGSEPVEADRVDDGAGEDVRADLRALLDHDDRDLGAFLGRELLQADRGRQAPPAPRRRRRRRSPSIPVRAAPSCPPRSAHSSHMDHPALRQQPSPGRHVVGHVAPIGATLRIIVAASPSIGGSSRNDCPACHGPPTS